MALMTSIFIVELVASTLAKRRIMQSKRVIALSAIVGSSEAISTVSSAGAAIIIPVVPVPISTVDHIDTG